MSKPGSDQQQCDSEFTGKRHEENPNAEGPRGWIIFLVAIGILISQAVVAVLGRSPSELMVGAAIMLLGIPFAANIDERRRG